MHQKHMPLLCGLCGFAVAAGLAARGVFVSRPDEPPPARYCRRFLLPIVLFVLALGLSDTRLVRVVSIPPLFLIAL